MRLLITIALFGLGLSPIFAQQEAWRQKIDTRLLERAEEEGKAEFLIILKAQADVSYAEVLRVKSEKGEYVFQTLHALADQSQSGLQKHLDDAAAPWLSFWVINAMWSVGPLNLIEQIAQMPEVARVEDNPVLHLQLVPGTIDTATMPASDRYTPNSWGLAKIKADNVWALGYTGSGVVVGGQDTGYEWQHPALKDKYRGWDGSVADHNYNWHDAIHALIGSGSNSCGINLTAPCDDTNHGTHTMGTMTGSDAGVAVGVAPDAKWMGCRNMEEGDGTPATYIECFQWFIAPTNLSNGSPDPTKAPDVINNSWGCPSSEGCNSGNYATMEAVIGNVRAAGIFVVVSAGNDGSACSTVNTPAAIFTNVFSVGATSNTAQDVIASFSSRGPVTIYGPTHVKPDISAPGVGINSCVGSNNNAGSYTYSNLSGTSMAGPHVAGVVALILSARPDLKGQVTEVENLIKNSAVPRFASSPFCGLDNASTLPNNVYGYGRIDALAAVNAAIGLPVELRFFDAHISGKTSLLQWATASEKGCARFEIQRSGDALAWQTLDAVDCIGEAGASYQFTDDKPLAGVNYYRLKQVDLNNAFAFSRVAAVSFTSTGFGLTVQVDNDAQTARFQIIGATEEQTLGIEIFGSDGRSVYKAPFYHQVVDTAGWPSDLYLVAVRNENERVVASGKLVKM